MANKTGRSVYQREDGTWVNKSNDAGRAGSLHDSQGDTEGTARRMLRMKAEANSRRTVGTVRLEVRTQLRPAPTPILQRIESIKD